MTAFHVDFALPRYFELLRLVEELTGYREPEVLAGRHGRSRREAEAARRRTALDDQARRLEALERHLQRLLEERATTDEVLSALETDLLSGSSIRRALPHSREEMYAFLALLVAVVSLVLGEVHQLQQQGTAWPDDEGQHQVLCQIDLHWPPSVTLKPDQTPYPPCERSLPGPHHPVEHDPRDRD